MIDKEFQTAGHKMVGLWALMPQSDSGYEGRCTGGLQIISNNWGNATATAGIEPMSFGSAAECHKITGHLRRSTRCECETICVSLWATVAGQNLSL